MSALAYTVLGGVAFGFAIAHGFGEAGAELLAIICAACASGAFADFMWSEQ